MRESGQELYRILRQKVLDAFLEQVVHNPVPCSRLMIVSPWITPLDRERYPLEWILNKLSELTFLGVVTREPTDEHHLEAVNILSSHPMSEVVYNKTVHAKLYVATFGSGKNKIALLGSANLTTKGNTQCEIGVLFFSRGFGRQVIDGLEEEYQFIRTLPWGKRVKCRGTQVI